MYNLICAKNDHDTKSTSFGIYKNLSIKWQEISFITTNVSIYTRRRNGKDHMTTTQCRCYSKSLVKINEQQHCGNADMFHLNK